MSEFFDEVDEEVRREQLKKLWDKYSLLIIGAAFLVVAAVGGWLLAGRQPAIISRQPLE